MYSNSDIPDKSVQKRENKQKVKHKRQNSQENIAVRGSQDGLVGGNHNVPRGQRAHELSDSSGDEAEQPVRVSVLRNLLKKGKLT